MTTPSTPPEKWANDLRRLADELATVTDELLTVSNRHHEPITRKNEIKRQFKSLLEFL